MTGLGSIPACAEIFPTTPRRSIPACAGEPGIYPPTRASTEVYPRVCGGTEYSIGKVAIATGLSPRVRGNLQQQVLGEHWLGSIPACAGEPCARRSSSILVSVYPRGAGEPLRP